MTTALRIIHIQRAKVEYKKSKATSAFEGGQLTEQEYNNEIAKLDESLKILPKFGQYVFK
jgi:hypothetical protein